VQSASTNAVHLRTLDPFDFLERSAAVFAEKTAIIDDDERITYPQMLSRVHRIAHILRGLGIQRGDRVAVIAPNVPQMLEMSFAVPLAGGILCAMNIRLAANEIAYILAHCGASAVIYDREFEHLLSACTAPIVRVSLDELDELDARATTAPFPRGTFDEDATFSINYTSGTTGQPKGVMYTYRGVYVNALSVIFHAGLQPESVYLWTLPMFHCNGWIFPWAVTGAGATHVCLRKFDAARAVELIEREGVTHFCGAPTVLVAIANHPDARRFSTPVHVITGGAPPAPKTIAQMETLGVTITHSYGLTETYGPSTACAWKGDAWDALSLEERARIKARQGVPMITTAAGNIRVVDEEMRDVPRDGVTQGEIVMRGNGVMKGYYNDPAATAYAFRGGYFHSGDVAVTHPDGYIEIADRMKDIIISGGENISTVQVERVIMEHPAVLECAVVAIPDEKWGEVPKAFVTLKNGTIATEAAIIAFCRERLPGFKTPKAVAFGDLPKTSTGKIQKYVLREREWAGRAKRVN
jgi:fatty-acyl-CoA synthase